MDKPLSSVALPRHRRGRLILWLVIILLLAVTVVVAALAQRWGLLSPRIVIQLLDKLR